MLIQSSKQVVISSSIKNNLTLFVYTSNQSYLETRQRIILNYGLLGKGLSVKYPFLQFVPTNYNLEAILIENSKRGNRR